MVGSFEHLVKNPRMQKFLKSQQGDSQVESSHHAMDHSIGQTTIVHEHVGRTPIVTTNPILPQVQAQDPGMNGQGSNAQMVPQTIPTYMATHPGYFGCRSVFQAMVGQPIGF